MRPETRCSGFVGTILTGYYLVEAPARALAYVGPSEPRFVLRQSGDASGAKYDDAGDTDHSVTHADLTGLYMDPPRIQGRDIYDPKIVVCTTTCPRTS